ncbi:MAG: hypothetical protein U1F36_14090 [Planctomycetota bacterium]
MQVDREASAAPSEIIPLERTRGVRRAMLLNDMLPGFAVLFGGLSLLSIEGRRAYAIISLLTGGALCAAGVREWRSSSESTSRFCWVDVCGGVVALLTALMTYKPQKAFQPATLAILVGVLLLVRGLFPHLFPRLRKLRLDEDGFSLRLSPLRSCRRTWPELERIETRPRAVTLHHRDGRIRTVSLRSVANAEVVVAALLRSASAHGVSVPERADAPTG